MIIDSFIFNDELDLLELRLGQLEDTVDYFVILEVDKTFTCIPKPFYFRDNQSRFSRWAHKIVHQAAGMITCGSWEFEHRQRELIVPMVQSVSTSPDDTLSFSDCDEIPNPETLKSYTPDLGLRNLKQYTYFYNYNHLFNYGRREWSRARMGTVDHMVKHGAVGFRGGWPEGRDLDHTFPSLENAGWHGSYFGADLERIRHKVASFSHDDLLPFIKARSDRQLAKDIHEGIDLYHRAGIANAQWVDTDDATKLPPYFLANKERFKLFTNEYFEQKYADLL